MDLALQLDKMTTIEKLRTLEEIWTDLARHADEIPVPEWHREVLVAREKSLKSGSEGFTDWKIAQEDIRKNSL